MHPKLSIVILTYNRADSLKRTLDSLMNQSCRDFEITVIDNGSTDGTKELLGRYPVRVYANLLKSSSKMRNFAAKITPTEVLAYLDSDTEAPPNWVENVVSAFERHPDIVAVGGPTVELGNQRMFGLYTQAQHDRMLTTLRRIYESVVAENKLFDVCRLFRSGAYSIGNSLPRARLVELSCERDFLCAGNVAYKREIFVKEGGYDENFIFNHYDTDLFIRYKRKGLKFLHDPEIFVWHRSHPNRSTRANDYLLGVDFGFYLMVDSHPESIGDFLRICIFAITLNAYWLRAMLEASDKEKLAGINGFIRGVKKGIILRRRRSMMPLPQETTPPDLNSWRAGNLS